MTKAQKSKKAIVYENLKKRIINHSLKPGEPLNEAVLSKELKISKTPIREAFQQLEKEGFIENIPGRGAFVSRISIQDIRELFEIREILECEVIRRVASKGDFKSQRPRPSGRNLNPRTGTETRPRKVISRQEIRSTPLSLKLSETSDSLNTTRGSRNILRGCGFTSSTRSTRSALSSPSKSILKSWRRSWSPGPAEGGESDAGPPAEFSGVPEEDHINLKGLRRNLFQHGQCPVLFKGG